MNRKLNSKLNIIKPRADLSGNVFLLNVAWQSIEGDEVWIRNFSIGNKWIQGTILCRIGPISYEALTEKWIVKKHVNHLRKKESPINDEIYYEVQLEKHYLHRNETTVNSPVAANSPSQNISDWSPQKQLRTQINDVQKSANDDLIEHQPEETYAGSSGGSGDSNIALRRSQRERRPPKYLEDYETWFDKYTMTSKRDQKWGVMS